jgi:propane monooxygenase small subunit
MTTTEPRVAEVPARPERSVPRVSFTDAEAGAKEFPDSSASARRYNYYVPAKRKQTRAFTSRPLACAVTPACVRGIKQ